MKKIIFGFALVSLVLSSCTNSTETTSQAEIKGVEYDNAFIQIFGKPNSSWNMGGFKSADMSVSDDVLDLTELFGTDNSASAKTNTTRAFSGEDIDWTSGQWNVVEQGHVYPGKAKEEIPFKYRILVEDLGSSSKNDMDYNDAVFSVACVKGKYKVPGTGENTGYQPGVWLFVQIEAAGGTLPITVDGNEIHKLFGVSTSQMVNTEAGKHDASSSILIVKKVADNITTFDFNNDIPVVVTYADGSKSVLSTTLTGVPHKLCVPYSHDWASEKVAIDDAFSDWKDILGIK